MELILAMLLGILGMILGMSLMLWAVTRHQKQSSEIASQTVLSVSTAISQTLVGSIRPLLSADQVQPPENTAESMYQAEEPSKLEPPWEEWDSSSGTPQ